MVEKLHRAGELDQRCLPIRHDRCLEADESLDDESETEKASRPVIDKQVIVT
jgi:hypothetical protein